jgi:ankyrin repeat protein
VLPHTAGLDDYEREAEAVLAAAHAGSWDARSEMKWRLPRYRDKAVSEVDTGSADVTDAKLIVASQCGFDGWDDLTAFVAAVAADPAVGRFEAAADALVSGDLAALRAMLAEHPELIDARSSRRHHATLLHYVGANGVEGWRQKTPANAVAIAKVLLDAGADVDAIADMYGQHCTTMSMLVSSAHPAQAGLQAMLAETLLDYGAAFDGPGSKWQSALETALAFGYLPTAQMLAGRGAAISSLAVAAGLGLIDEAAGRLPSASPEDRHAALALAAQHGHVAIVRLLLDAGEDPNRYNPDGHHAHSTPLHQAVAANHPDVVELLVARGARLDVRDTIWGGTPLGWALHEERAAIAESLRQHGAPA